MGTFSPVAYFDHAATTPMAEEAVAAMLPFLTEHFANPSGVHAAGRAARRALDDARDEVAALVGCEPGEVVFTSGGTEADNLALSLARTERDAPLVVSSVEHHAVLRPAQAYGAHLAPVDADGVIDLDALCGLLDATVSLVSVMAVNNEVGVVEPLEEVCALVRERAPRALLHTDAVQAVPWLDVAAVSRGYDLVTISGHKFGGPKGVGALVVRGAAREALVPLLRGGPQERELRAGTENVAGIVAMGVAARLHGERRAAMTARVRRLRDRLEDGLLDALPQVAVAAPRAKRVAGSCPLVITGVESEELLVALDRRGVAASAGSACASGALEASHVLLAMGRSPEEARGQLRLSLGWTSTDGDVDAALESLPAALSALGERPTER